MYFNHSTLRWILKWIKNITQVIYVSVKDTLYTVMFKKFTETGI